ncbi:MAG: hypothetical protein MUE58_01130 [Chitinophagaceae bacterium]|jgi:hypothetical protein|nr:hypothetical protein [Chitinophagaceae bacterium]
MKKLSLLVFVFSLYAMSLNAQQNRIPDILNHPWVLEKETMSGVGTHQSLPENTVLLLRPDYTWTSSAPIEGMREGSWRETGKESLTMAMAGNRKAELRVLDDGRLRLIIPSGLAKTTVYWKKEGR